MAAYLDLAALSLASRVDHPGAVLYCLVDHAGMPGLGHELATSTLPWRSLFAGSREEAALGVAPLMFCVDVAQRLGHHELLRWVAEHGTYTSSMLLLASPLDLDELAARLARRLDAQVPDEIDVLLRFFDPRVFAALVDVLDVHARAAFLGVADAWWFLDRAGGTVAVPSTMQAEDGFVAPLRLDAAQAQALAAASEPDQVEMRLKGLVPALLQSVVMPERHGFIVAQMAAGRARGLASLHDLTLYCVMVLTDGADFAGAPDWQAAFGEVRAGTLGFGDAIRRLAA